jgi:aquaporin Z
MSMIGKLVAEAIGTFFLCFLGAGAICLATHKGFAPGADLLAIAIAHGIALSVAVSATMNTSGGHLNPAVTVAMLVTKRIDLPGAIQYIIAQLAGATIAGVLVLMIFKGMTTGSGTELVKAAGLGTPSFNEPMTMGMAIFIESILTFLLVFTIFGTAVDPRAPKIGGFGIGLIICADILVGGPLTGAAMNPARTFGPGIVAAMTGNLDVFWKEQAVYWIGPILGAVIAALVYDNLILKKQA